MILKFAFGPEKFPGLSNNGPQKGSGRELGQKGWELGAMEWEAGKNEWEPGRRKGETILKVQRIVGKLRLRD